ncbi:MAG TPA: rhombosortase [Steroidobacteraceae bacterium]|nr:rhombosortase [Steroidobacteraceae bacterium]
MSLLLVGLYFGGAPVLDALAYERVGVLEGQWWRLLGGHLVHADAAHLAWNLLGLWLVAVLFVPEFTLREWLLIVVASTAAIDVGFLWLQPDLIWYVGFSGVLHGGMAAGLLAWLRQTPRDPLTLALAALFAGKLLYEQLVGPLPFTAATLSVPVLHEAHSYGAAGGVAAAAGLVLRRRGGGARTPI